MKVKYCPEPHARSDYQFTTEVDNHNQPTLVDMVMASN
jgi:hypothetical protein